jgi:hypothetical protein
VRARNRAAPGYEEDAMRHRAIWLAGVVALAGAGPAAAQTGAGGTTTAIPRTNQTHAPTTGGLNLTAPLPKTGGTALGVGSNHRAGGSPLITPIPKTGGSMTGGTMAGGSLGGVGAKHTGTGSTGSTAATGGGVMGGRLVGQGVVGNNLLGNGVVGSNLLGPGVTGSSVLVNGSATTAGDQIALLAEARLLVLQLEATGNLTLSRRESMLLTLLLYEALRQQAVQAGAGAGTAPTTGTVHP